MFPKQTIGGIALQLTQQTETHATIKFARNDQTHTLPIFKTLDGMKHVMFAGRKFSLDKFKY